MKQLECIIIEDEPLAQAKLIEFIKKVNFLSLAATFDNGIEAIYYLKEHHIDLVFLDIQMKDFDGMQFLKTVTQKPKIIITSAYSQYALKGYEYRVSDYLLKPFGLDRFLKAIEKVTTELLPEQPVVAEQPVIFVKTEYRMERIQLNDIFYIEGMKDYLAVVTHDKKIMTLMSFKNMLDLLPPFRFARVHKSFIVAIDKIAHIERSRISIKDKLIPVSDSYKDDFLNLLKNHKYMN